MTKDENKLLEKELVLFELGKEIYGVDISVVYEIIRMQEITKVPKAPFFVEGIVNLRGKVIPIVDMRKRFGLPRAEQNKDNRIMVLESSGQNVGIIVDAVTEVLRIPSESVEPPSNIIVSSASDYILGIAKHDKNMIILLDMERVLSKESIGSVSGITQETDESNSTVNKTEVNNNKVEASTENIKTADKDKVQTDVEEEKAEEMVTSSSKS